MSVKSIGLACDHAGVQLKKMISDYLSTRGLEVSDFGVSDAEPHSVDYPDMAALVCVAMGKGQVDSGIAICGTGLGMAISANKFPGVRAACVWDEYSARMAKSHNDANLLCLGSRSLNFHRAIDLVSIWLDAQFAGERHQMRLDKIYEIEKKNFKADVW